MNTCRLCGDWYKDSFMIKYAVRHSAHFACIVKRGRMDILEKLTNWQLAQIPIKEIRSYHMLETITFLYKEREKTK